MCLGGNLQLVNVTFIISECKNMFVLRCRRRRLTLGRTVPVRAATTTLGPALGFNLVLVTMFASTEAISTHATAMVEVVYVIYYVILPLEY